MLGKLQLLVPVLILMQVVSTELKASVIVLNNSTRPIQKQLSDVDAVYEIRTAIDLKGESISIPKNSILKFEGGELKNGEIKYVNTFIEGRYDIQCSCEGLIANDIVEPHMFGARGDGKSDDSHAIQQTINSGKQVLFKRATYIVTKPIIFDRQNFIVDFNFSIIKKVGKSGLDYKYENFDYNEIPCIIFFKPYQSNTSGHIVIRNLSLDGNNVNAGIHAIWCRNVILDNIRIYGTTQGLVYKGFTNSFRDITIWNSKEGFVLLGGNATLFERCFTSNCGWNIDKAHGYSLIGCSSDDNNPCYSISNSTVSMIGCTQESKGDGIVVKNSVLELSGDYESHIYDSTKSITYIKAIESSVIYAKGCTFRLNNYLRKKVPNSNLFEIYDNSKIELEGRVDHGNVLKIYKSNNGKMSLNGRSLKSGNN